MQDSTAAVLDPYTMNADGTSNLMTIILIPYGAEGMNIPTLSTRQIICGPTIATEKDGPLYKTIRTPNQIFDLAQFLSVLPEEQTPEIIIVWTDSTLTTFPVNLAAFPNCRKLFMVGDTHHQRAPLQNMLVFAASNPFDAIIFMFRQHVHFFRDAGFSNAHWIQGQMTFPDVKPIETARRQEIILLGGKGDQHPQRRRIIEELENSGYPLSVGFYPHAQAMALYAQVQISLNVSLNGDMNWRPFEVIGAGGFLITDRLSHFSGLDILFEEGTHYISFSSIDDLKAKLDYYLANPEECVAIATRGQLHYLKHFSRDQITRAIWNQLLYNRSSDFFHIPDDERLCEKYDDQVQILPRVGVYETIQEYQRIQLNVKILFLQDAPPVLISDCADLPRVEIFIESGDRKPLSILSQIAPYKQMTYLDNASAAQKEWDIVVATHPVEAKSVADAYKAQTIIIANKSWKPNQPPQIDECPAGFTPSPYGYAIFEKRPPPYLNYLAQEFGLAGKEINNAAMSIGFREKRVIEIGGCTPERLVTGTGARSWLGLIDHPDESTAAANPGDRAALQTLSAIPDYAAYQARLTDLPASLHGQFDLVYSFRGMNAIDHFLAMLQAAYAALRPNGKLFFSIDPLWSAHDGHALPQIVDASGQEFSRENSGIPPWGHLLMSEDEMGTHLFRQTDPATVAKILDHVYRSPRLNRMFAEDYNSCVQQISFKAGTGRSLRDDPVPEEILSALTKKYPGYRNFQHGMLRYEFRK